MENRKRKNSIDESGSAPAQLKTRRLSVEISASDYRSSTCDPDHVSASCCSSNGSKLSTKFVDLENDTEALGFFETSAGDDDVDYHSLDFTVIREITRPSGELGELDSTAMPPHDSNSDEKMPSEAEIEDFFAAAEKNLQRKFIDKYNFDMVKEQPLEGRYEWVQIKLNP